MLPHPLTHQSAQAATSSPSVMPSPQDTRVEPLSPRLAAQLYSFLRQARKSIGIAGKVRAGM